MRIGAHVRSGGGVFNAIDHAEAMGAETIQIFSGSPQAWRRKNYTTAEVEKYKARVVESGVAPAFIHGLYLVNLASQNPDVLAKSYDALTAEMNAASLIGARGVIFHLGSHKGAGYDAIFQQVVDYIRKVIDATPEDAHLILENSAGTGGVIGSSFAELGRIVKEVGSDRVRVCVDSQHAFAAGHNWLTPSGVDAAMDEFDREIGLDLLSAVHANDSKCELGGGRDRHENIGDGHIGRQGFANILAHPAFAEVPFLLEVPGYDDHGPDKQNVDTLKAIRAEVGLG
jgi:deoxyribonuclease-4